MALRERIENDEITIGLGAYDAISAKMADQLGGELVYMSGSSVATATTGDPDVGLATQTEMTTRARQMTGAIEVPLMADADTGYGNPLNVRRTVEEYERAGVSAIQLEDQTFPKRCGHFDGKSVIPADEFSAKLRAAVDARQSEDFLIVARTDALATEGVEDAIDRANQYRDAGADILFVEAPQSREQMKQILTESPGIHVANMATGGRTPVFPADELQEMGYDIALYAAEAFRGALNAYKRIYSAILQDGSQEAIVDDIVGWDERNNITGLDRIQDLEERYATE